MHRCAPILALLSALAVAGCQPRNTTTPGATDQPAVPTAEPPSDQHSRADRRLPAGASCAGRGDCPSDQVCVAGACTYRQTVVSAEILATAAEARAHAGDWEGAIETYERALGRFQEAGAPLPPGIACRAAHLILRTARNAEARELGAQRAHLCFRASVPGHPVRQRVQRALARLRFEGLELARFDEDEPSGPFFDPEAARRPTVDAIEVEIQMPDLEPREPTSHATVREVMSGESGRRAVAECFLQDWELNHSREVTAEIVLRFSISLRDMGSYDVYVPRLQVEQTTTTEDGFEPCLLGSLDALFEADERPLRGEAWNQVVRLAARVP